MLILVGAKSERRMTVHPVNFLERTLTGFVQTNQKLKTMKKVKTWLPVFRGFYGTELEPYEDYEIESIKEQRELFKLSGLPYEAIKWDYDSYQTKVAENCCDFIEGALENFVSKITFQEICSPREYNFANDSINIEVSLSKDNIKSIKLYLLNNKSQFETYVHENYTSCSGFISWFDNDANNWLFDIDNVLEDKHQLGSILQFICYNEDKHVYTFLIEMVLMDVTLQALNYDECTIYEYCSNCHEFFEPSKGVSNICNDCYENSVLNYDIIICSCCKTEITNKWMKREFIHKLKHGFIKPDQIRCDKHNFCLA